MRRYKDVLEKAQQEAIDNPNKFHIYLEDKTKIQYNKLNDAVNKVVIDQILTDFLLGSTTIHNTREADDSRRSVRGKP